MCNLLQKADPTITDTWRKFLDFRRMPDYLTFDYRMQCICTRLQVHEKSVSSVVKIIYDLLSGNNNFPQDQWILYQLNELPFFILICQK